MDPMRALIPSNDADDAEADVHEFYARDWVDGGGLRVNFVSRVDGAATEDGVSKGLQTPGDNRVFAALRDLADVVLAGAGTVRTEGYEAITVSARRAALRAQHGFAPGLTTAVISRSLRLDPASPLFTGAPPDNRTIVLTCAAGDPEVRGALEQVADVVECGDGDVDLGVARHALEERGLTRILCEGGPTLFAELGRAGVVDELCLSITPMLSGPGARRIVAGELWSSPRQLRLTSLLEEDGALFCRYRLA
jgi:riboflavin biosynthesis pyrimidine reductase